MNRVLFRIQAHRRELFVTRAVCSDGSSFCRRPRPADPFHPLAGWFSARKGEAFPIFRLLRILIVLHLYKYVVSLQYVVILNETDL